MSVFVSEFMSRLSCFEDFVTVSEACKDPLSILAASFRTDKLYNQRPPASIFALEMYQWAENILEHYHTNTDPKHNT